MKKILGIILSASMLLATAPCSLAEAESAQSDAWCDIYVSASGNDNGDGSKGSPFKTLERAQEEVRSINDQMAGDIVVHVGNGKYYLDKGMVFETEDSGKNGYNVIWQGEDKENTKISGGKVIDGFKKSDKGEGLWEAYAPDFEYIHQLFVNGERRYVARSASPVTGQRKSAELDTKEYYEANPGDPGKEYEFTYWDPETPYKYDGIFVNKRDLGIYENYEDMIVWQDKGWVTTFFEVDEIFQNPYNSDQFIVRLDNPLFSRLCYGADTPFNANRGFWVMNAMELLDEPGEFYFNKKTKMLYYMPCEGEELNKTEVIAPKVEDLIVFNGSDIDKKVTNVTFKDLTLCETGWEYCTATYDQAISADGKRVLDSNAFKAVKLSYVDNVNFEDNIFANIAGAAIYYLNACSNVNVKGNVMYDVGENGIVAGRPTHDDWALQVGTKQNPESKTTEPQSWPVPEEHKNDPVNLVVNDNTRVDASEYGGSTGNLENVMTYRVHSPVVWFGNAYVTLNKTWFDEDSLTEPYPGQRAFGKGAWKDEKSVKKGEKPWVKYEFLKPYDIDEVILAFDSETVSDAEKSDFEILGSNDIAFKDYDVLATQNGAVPGEIGRYKLNTDKKYQYIMVRSLDSKVLAISGSWITTYDIKPFVKLQRCTNLNIENNVLNRIGTDIPRSIGITIVQADGAKILHNDLKDIAYTGISSGYRWHNDQVTCRDIEIGYNRIYDCTQSMLDGGGIYVLSGQPNSVIHHNYINAANLANNAIYLDAGSRYMTFKDNVIVGGTYMLSIRMQGPQGMCDNVLKNNYANHSISNSYAAVDNEYEPQIVIPTGSVVDATSYDTVYNSGVEKEYEANLSLVPEGMDRLGYKYDINYIANKNERLIFHDVEKKAVKEWLEYTLENTDFGPGLGQMPKKYKSKVKQMISYFGGEGNTDDIMQLTEAHELERELTENVNRYTLDETLALCEEKLAFVKENLVPAEGKLSCDRYPKAAAEAFEKTLGEVKSAYKEDLSADEQWKLLLKLENAYNTVEESRNIAEITYVSSKNMTDYEIDNINREVKIYVPKSAGNTLSEFEMEISPNCSLARIVTSELDLTEPVIVPLRVNGNGRYKLWKITLVHAEDKKNANAGEANWITTTDEAKFMIKKYADGSTMLPAGEYIYMADSCSQSGENYVTFKPMTKNKLNGFTAILGAEKAQGQEKSATGNNRCELIFDNNRASFYKVVGGSKTLITEASSVPIKYDDKNTVKYSVEEIDNNLYFKIYLNDTLVMSPVVEKYPYDNYIGFYSKYMDIKIYK